MFPDSVSSVVWLVLLIPATTSTHSSLHVNTLLFSSGAPGYNIQNCSCPEAVGECDEALAISLCRCHTVLRSSLPPAGLREAGPLTIWVKEGWVLKELLDSSAVGHLHLSFCGVKPLDSQYVALLGLQTLRIHSAVPLALYPHQEMNVSPPERLLAQLDSLWPASDHLTVVDLAVLNGLSALKAYRLPAQPHHLHHLRLPSALLTGPHGLLITFIY